MTVKILNADGTPMRQGSAGGTLARTGVDRALAEWHPALKSADADILPKRNQTTARARDLISGNGFAAAGSRRNNVNTIGSGLRLDYHPNAMQLGLDEDSEEFRQFVESVEAEFDLYSRDTDTGADHSGRTHLGGLAKQAFTHYEEDGDACTNVLWSRDPARRYQTCFQNIDPDRLSTPTGAATQQLPQGRVIKGGVEQTASGRPLAYHIRTRHASEALLGGTALARWQRIPARVRGTRRKNFIHYYDFRRAGQSRGKSRLASVIEKFKKLDLFQDTSLKAALINAMFSFWIESPFDDQLIADQLGVATEENGKITAYQKVRTDYHDTARVRIGDMQPLLLAPGERGHSLDANRPSPEYAAFVQAFMEEMAAANGQSLEQYTGNWTKTNYSSARAALNEAWKILKVERDEFARHWYGAVFALWFEEALDKGHITLPSGAPSFYENRPAWLSASWIGPGRGYVDPVKEVEAQEKRMALGLTSLHDETAEQGGDFRQKAKQIKREKKFLEGMDMAHPMDIARQRKVPSHARVPTTDARQTRQDDEEDSNA